MTAAGLVFEHVRTKDPATKFTTKLYCEHPMLSLQHPGDVVKMLKVLDPSKIQTMTTDMLQDFLDAAAVVFDFSTCRPTTAPEREAVARLQERALNEDKADAVVNMLGRMAIDGPKSAAQLREGAV